MEIELNCVYNIDNIILMKSIPTNFIDLIYCDILYGTGRNFDDYQDLKPVKSIIDEHYIPRIKEMHRILKDTGSIYLQMDVRINHWIRCILDDIFGYENFVNEIIWGKSFGGTTLNKFNPKHDTILFYTKSKKYTFNPILKNNTGNFNKKEKSMIFDYWIDIPQINNIERNTTKKYSTQKPKKLLERIIHASSNKGDIVADFYSGSGTTGVVCKNKGRNYIMSDISTHAVKISEKRIKNTMKSLL